MAAGRFLPCVLVAGALAAGGCATMTKEQCAAADWASVGYADGSAGFRAGRVARHADACGEHGFSVDRAAYREGYAEGRADYCSTTDPYELGLDGRDYRGICDQSFGEAYRLGKRIHDYREEIEALERDIRSLEADYADTDDSDERRRIRARIDDKREAIDDLRRRIIATRALGADGEILIDILD